MISKEAAQSYQRLRQERQEVLRLLNQPENVYELQAEMVYDSRRPDFSMALSAVQQHLVQQIQETEALISNQQYLAALKILHNCQLLADCFLSSEREIEPWLTVYLLSNLGICFHHFSLLDQAYSCYESCEDKLQHYLQEPEGKEIRKVGSLNDLSKWLDPMPRNINLKMQLTQLRIAMGTIFFCIDKKEEAFKFYKRATSFNLDLMIQLLESEREVHSSKTLTKQTRPFRSHSPKTAYDLVSNQQSLNCLQKHRAKNPIQSIITLIYSTVEDIIPLFRRNKQQKRVQKERLELPITKLNEFFQNNPYNLTLQQISRPPMLRRSEFSQNEPNIENIMQLIITTCLCLYYMACCHGDKHQYQSQLLMNKCIEICYTYLPINVPFVKQIIKTYNVCFGVEKQTIPEYGQVVHTVKFIRSSLNKNHFGKLFVPCIRNIKVLRYQEDEEDRIKRKYKLKREVRRTKMTSKDKEQKESTLLQKIINLMEFQGILQKNKPKPPTAKLTKKTPISGRSTSDEDHPSAAVVREKRA